VSEYIGSSQVSLSGTSDQPLQDRFEEAKGGDHEEVKHKKQTVQSEEEEDVVNEIDTFLIEDDDL